MPIFSFFLQSRRYSHVRYSKALYSTFLNDLLPETIPHWSGGYEDIENLIQFEDKHLIVIFKPPQILSQQEKESRSDDSTTDLISLLRQYRVKKRESEFIGLVHRLDRPTSGLMVFAKHTESLKKLNELFHTNFKGVKTVHKAYLAIVNGRLESEGQLVDFLRKSERAKSTVYNPDKRINSNKTEVLQELLAKIRAEQELTRRQASYSTVAAAPTTLSSTSLQLQSMDQSLVIGMMSYKSLLCEDVQKLRHKSIESSNTKDLPPKFQTLLDISLQTGRKHQIRAQLAARNHSIVGDRKYGASQKFVTRDICLHSYYLSFPHPIFSDKCVKIAILPPRIWVNRFPQKFSDKIKEIVSSHTNLM